MAATTVAPSGLRNIFVYGSLRPGCHNARLWQGIGAARWDGTAYVIGYKLVNQGWFPYLVRAASAQTVGALIVPDEGWEWEVLRRMDALEGVPVHYERMAVGVMTPDGPERAWTYVPTSPAIHLDCPDVPTSEGGFFDWREVE